MWNCLSLHGITRETICTYLKKKKEKWEPSNKLENISSNILVC